MINALSFARLAGILERMGEDPQKILYGLCSMIYC